ncbi:exonuclease, DNA polymerase III, epsilon subunit family [Mycolicibacterium rhodesiae NBB3]|uniref:Exonuclease, DNA polymerase III, epsilon subunit family n=1 Tax=Mycolicibacterium rhodesiae (strain NBB3) TaxID=710685 RepID=G8RNX0_MYCRN|nr:exonuclease, DNA polymerase III, epsilon subunit family [Mycolicibacterium rhodesiae NBB3]
MAPPSLPVFVGPVPYRQRMGQLSFADVDPLADVALRETTFVVVDLETTGGRASGDNHDAITEIGAVKVRGGEVLGEFATLVDPGRSIPPQIVSLTGITTAMVCDAPRIESVLPAFLEFSRGAVLVAHNAGFDIGFLRAAAERAHITWSRPPVLCTVRLARRVLTRDEAPSVRLSALARLFNASTTPTHRALDDARATVDVLHGLIERVGNQGVHTYTELRSYLPDVSPAQRRNRHLATHLPRRPGVYLFRGPASEVLYVGTAVDLRRRVSQYFNGADPRTRIKEMASLAIAVDHVECAHDLEAGVRELRLLAAHAPPYNRRSKFPHRWWWVVLTDEAFPRFSVVRSPKHECVLGPFRSRADAVQTAALLARFTGVRTCTTRLGRSASHGPKCPEREVSPCPAAHGFSAADYAHTPRRARDLIEGIDSRALADVLAHITDLAERARYETAARLRDHATVAIDTLWRGQRLRALADVGEMVAARPDGAGGWHLAVIRHGQLAAAGNAQRGVPPMPVVDAICAGAQAILPNQAPLGGALVEETALIARWLARPGVRIVRADSGYASPAGSAGRFAAWSASARSARIAAEQLAEADSELLTEPHPTREQLFGGAGVDGLGRLGQTSLPRGNPLGVAG